MKSRKSKIVHGNAGRRDEANRSDCYVELTVTTSGGIKIQLSSKVEALYGKSIISLVRTVLLAFKIRHARVLIEDKGAVPFVLAARVEAAARRALPGLKESYLLPIVAKVRNGSRDRLRRTRLYLPGNEPRFFLNAGLHQPDCVILDLEDSVAHSEKVAARILVRNALRQIDFGNAELMVRINQLPLGLEDLECISESEFHSILIPKCESAETIHEVENKLRSLFSYKKKEHKIFLLPIIESARGIVRAFEIASASEWNCAIAIGLEDYTADIGVQRTEKGIESLFARSVVVNAAKAAGIQALDSVFSDVADDDGLRKSAIEAKGIGFDGKGCIHPRQIKIIHEALSPSSEEVEYAQRVLQAFEEARLDGSGVVALGSKMIDAPVVKRAKRTLLLSKMKMDKENQASLQSNNRD